MHYILDEDGEPARVDDILEWGRWYEENGDLRRLARTDLDDGVFVSTVFLAIDHNFVSRPTSRNPNVSPPPPVLWELMVFGGEHNEYQERFTSKEAALARHTEVVHLLQGKLPLGVDEGPLEGGST